MSPCDNCPLMNAYASAFVEREVSGVWNLESQYKTLRQPDRLRLTQLLRPAVSPLEGYVAQIDATGCRGPVKMLGFIGKAACRGRLVWLATNEPNRGPDS